MKERKNCECCFANYDNGENMWCQLPDPDAPTKGRCEFCRRGTEYYLNKKAPRCTLEHDV